MWIYINFFFFNDTATTEIYSLSLHDPLPILVRRLLGVLTVLLLVPLVSAASAAAAPGALPVPAALPALPAQAARSEEHTSELQSQSNIVCRLLLEKKTLLRSYNSILTSYPMV